VASLKLIQFSGEIPRLLPRLLPDTGASHAENVRLDDGGLTPVRGYRQEAVITGITAGNVKTIFKNGTEWLAWDKVVHAAPGPVATDRLYFTGDGKPKMRYAGVNYDLAVPAPSTALSGSVSGTGTGTVITRLYCYTYVTDLGEESAPCPISADINWQSGQTVTLSGFAAPPGGRLITKQRIYRSQSSNQSGTGLFLLEERVASTSNFVDTYAPDAFQEALPSLDWDSPPDDLTGLIALPNGMMAAFSGKDLYFCEPFRPHAWPEKYVLTMSYAIVALGAFGNTIVVATEGQPEIVTGNSPDSMTQEKLETNLPCLNPRGMVDLGYAVAYPSNDGLVVVDSSGPKIKNELFTRPQWQKLSPATLVAAQFSGRYVASYSYTEIDGTPAQGTIIIDLTGEQPFLLRGGDRADAMAFDIKTGALYQVFGTDIREWDALGQVNSIMTWLSKQFVLPAPASFGAILVEKATSPLGESEQAQADAKAAIVAANAAAFAQDSIGGEFNGAAMNAYAIDGDDMHPLPADLYATVEVYADDALVASISTLDTVKRIAPVRAKNWQVRVLGTQPLAQITLATAARELNEV
jgi:hypothetical protein